MRIIDAVHADIIIKATLICKGKVRKFEVRARSAEKNKNRIQNVIENIMNPVSYILMLSRHSLKPCNSFFHRRMCAE
jgi:hypothetical protein